VLLGAPWLLGAELAAPGVISDAGGVDPLVNRSGCTVGNGCGITAGALAAGGVAAAAPFAAPGVSSS
jgi:hypothetical protein